MAGTVAELRDLLEPDLLAKEIADLYETWDNQRQTWLAEKEELRNFLFATDTSKTSNASLPWKNKTTLPKLTQIRDNLHANYLANLFPNDSWLKWEANTQEDALLEKRVAIQAYMTNKLKLGNFRTIISKLLYDYIDYGNVFVDAEWVEQYKEDPETGQLIPSFIGPKARRVSPLDIVFNPLAVDFESSPKITRTLMTLGELKAQVEESQDNSEWMLNALEELDKVRSAAEGNYSLNDFKKAVALSVDGFGNYQEYLRSGWVEILEIEGDLYDPVEKVLLRNHVVTIADRRTVLRKSPMPSWLGTGYKRHAGWRLRPDNLYAMGPLDNLVGMQYRIDHLENLKADVFDLIAFPPLKIIGEVEDFNWGPGEEILIDEGGSDVQMLVPDTTALNADTQIALLEAKMEEFAGAPKQAMGIRTPGEKTAFEVQALQNAAGRIFQEKINNFEINVLEPLLNSMLELARRNLNIADTVRVMDDDLGVETFMSVTRKDITAEGKLRPIGARHFAEQAQLIQNLTQMSTTPLWQQVAPHLSSKRLATLIEDTLNLERFDLFKPNQAVMEQMETQELLQQAQEEVDVQRNLDTEE